MADASLSAIPRTKPSPTLAAMLMRRMILLTALQAFMAVAAIELLLAPALQKQAAASMQAIAGAIARHLAGRVEQVNANSVAAARLISEARATDGQNIQAVLQMLQRETPSIVTSYILDQRGRVELMASTELQADQLQQRLGLDLSRSPVFLLGSKAEGGFTEPFLSSISERLMAGVAHPIGQSRLLVSELGLTALSAELSQDAAEAGYSAMVIDRSGRVIAQYDAQSALQSAQLGARQLEALSAAGGLHQLDFDEQAWMVSVSKIESQGLGWKMLVMTRKADLYGPVRQVALGATLLGLFIVAVSLVLSVALGRTVAVRARSLAAHADSLAMADAPPVSRIQGIAEFDRLLQHLDAMAVAVRERERALQELNASLESQVQSRTERLAMSNQQLELAMEDLRRTQNQLINSGKLAALGEMVASIAHELNTPIGNAVIAASTISEKAQELDQAMASGALTRSQATQGLALLHDGGQIIERNLERAARLVSSFKQVAVDQTTEQHRNFQLANLVSEIAMVLSPRLRKSGVDIDVQIDQTVEMSGYPGPLGQVLTNIIENGIFHGYENGSGRVSLVARTLNAETVEIVIKDQGVGMSAEVMQRIFDPFFTTRRNQGGTGLGMTIVHNLVTGILGGQISVQSAPGAGTSFTLTLPLRISALASKPVFA